MDIYVLGFGEGFQLVFNFIALFVKGGIFASLLKLAALIGIITTTTAYLKGRDPMVYAKWIFIYTVVSGLILTPKTNVNIIDRTANKQYAVANVPYIIGAVGSVVTNVGVHLAETYESLLALPDSRSYTKTGMLFGANLLKATHQFKIINPTLKEDMNRFFRNCVVGDIAINHKYNAAQVRESKNTLSLFMSNPSPVRRTVVDGKNLSCQKAVTDENVGLKKRLDSEVQNAYTFYGKQLFGKPAKDNTYKNMFETHLGDASEYFKKVRNSSESIVMQNMMRNAIDNGLTGFAAKTDSSAGILNNQFSKSQTQHREAWNIGTEKAIWFLPLMHSVLLLMCFAVFPIILAFAASPGGAKVFKSFIMFLVSFQLWPVLFSVLNVLISLYGSHKIGDYGIVTAVNIDSLEQVHNDVAGVAGFLMMSIPFLAKGFTSNIGEAFAGLATSLTSHMQSSSMAMASEVANASYSLGNNNVHNMTSNNLSANKHDTNWTEMHGNHIAQTGSNALVTTTPTGETIVNAQGAMGHSAIGISNTNGISNSLTNAKELAKVASQQHQDAFNSSIQQSSLDAIGFNKSHGNDIKAGNTYSSSEATSASNAMTRVVGKAQDVADKLGITTQDALGQMSQVGLSAHLGVDSKGSLPGKLFHAGTGISGGGSFKMDGSTTSSHSNGAHSGLDQVLSAKEMEDVRHDLQTVANFSKNHHVDTNNSQSENLLVQTGNDLRAAQSESQSYSNSLSDSMRISNASNFVESNASNISRNLNQEAFNYGKEKYGKKEMVSLESSPGDSMKMDKLQHIKEEFFASKAQEIIDKHGSYMNEQSIADFNKQGGEAMSNAHDAINQQYQSNKLNMQNAHKNLTNNSPKSDQLPAQVNNNLESNQRSIEEGGQHLQNNLTQSQVDAQNKIKQGQIVSRKSASDGAFKAVKKTPGEYYQALKNSIGDK